MVAAAIGGGALLSAGASVYGSSQAASAQGKAGRLAMMQQQQMYNETKANLAPFVQQGQGAGNWLAQLTGTDGYGNPLTAELTRKFQPTMEELEQTPGYQFALDQGLKGVQNSYAAKGLGNSGAALKGAATFAQGLASTTYQQQFQNYLNQNNQIFNMLQGRATLGANAAAGLGTQATQTGQGIAQTQAGIGNAQAAGYTTGAAGVANAGNSAINQYLQYSQMQALLGQGGGFGGGVGAALTPGSGGLY